MRRNHKSIDERILDRIETILKPIVMLAMVYFAVRIIPFFIQEITK